MHDILFAHPDEKLSGLYHQKLRHHFRVHKALDGLSAVRLIRQVKPKAIISDYHLPLLSGKSLIRFVRNFRPTAHTPFIFLTDQEFDQEALDLGANDWMPLRASHPDLVIEKTFYHLKLR